VPHLVQAHLNVKRTNMEIDLKEQIKIMEAKVAQIVYDIDQFRQKGHADKRVETLEFYKEYMEDELKMLKQRYAGN
jgi:hypothetical protein